MIPSVTSLAGKAVAQVIFKACPDEGWRDITSDELCKGRSVLLFALPGAYTPTCWSTHLPGYNELAPVSRQNRVDDIICMAANDVFFINEWKADQGADNITVIPDGNGEFTRGMGLLVDKRELGFGMRSWRYSMLVKDGIIAKVFIEPEQEGDPFDVSDADTTLAYINPEAKKPEPVAMLPKPGCPYCARAKAVLNAQGIALTDISQDKHINTRVLLALSGHMTGPQVFQGGRLTGNADAVAAHFGASAA